MTTKPPCHPRSYLPAPTADTIVIKNHAGRLSVQGPATFQEGYPVPYGGHQDGSFGEWHWDGEELKAHVDRLGMFPLYYAEIPNGIAVSTSIDSLIRAGVSSEIDWISLQLLLRLGFPIGCDTVFRAVKCFPVGGVLTWRPGCLKVEERFPQIRHNALSRCEAIDGYIDLFRCSLRRRIADGAPVRLPLRGGRDSRHIFLELCSLGTPPELCFTSSHANMEDDVRVAKMLCATQNVNHSESRVPENENVVAVELQKNRLMSFCALEHAWLLLLAEDSQSAKAISYDGIAGDVLSAGHFHDDENSRLYREGCFEELAIRLAPKMKMVLLQADFREKGDSVEVVSKLVAELVRYKNTQNPMMFFFFFNRTRRAVSPIISCLLGRGLRAVYAPFLDRNVYDFLAGLPESMFSDKGFHSQAISRAYPQYADIPYAVKTSIPQSFFLKHARQGMAYFLSHKSPLVSRTAVLTRFARSVAVPAQVPEALWVFRHSLLLVQLGQYA